MQAFPDPSIASLFSGLRSSANAGGVGKRLVLDLKCLPGMDRFDDAAQRVGIDAAHRTGGPRRRPAAGRSRFPLAWRGRPRSTAAATGSWPGSVQEQGLEVVALDVGAGALVVKHVVRRHAQVAVQVDGCVVLPRCCWFG